MTVTITKTVDIKTLPLEDLQSMPQLELAELLFRLVHEEHDPREKDHLIPSTTSEATDMLQELQDVVNLSDEDFTNFRYTKSQEMLEQERLTRQEFGTVTAEVESDLFSTWKVKYWEKLEELDKLLLTNLKDQAEASGGEQEDPKITPEGNDISQGKKEAGWHRYPWTPELKAALLRSANIGHTIDEIYAEGQKNGHKYSKHSYASQFRLAGYSVIGGVIVKRTEDTYRKKKLAVVSVDNQEEK